MTADSGRWRMVDGRFSSIHCHPKWTGRTPERDSTTALRTDSDGGPIRFRLKRTQQDNGGRSASMTYLTLYFIYFILTNDDGGGRKRTTADQVRTSTSPDRKWYHVAMQYLTFCIDFKQHRWIFIYRDINMFKLCLNYLVLKTLTKTLQLRFSVWNQNKSTFWDYLFIKVSNRVELNLNKNYFK